MFVDELFRCLCPARQKDILHWFIGDLKFAQIKVCKTSYKISFSISKITLWESYLSIHKVNYHWLSLHLVQVPSTHFLHWLKILEGRKTLEWVPSHHWGYPSVSANFQEWSEIADQPHQTCENKIKNVQHQFQWILFLPDANANRTT